VSAEWKFFREAARYPCTTSRSEPRGPKEPHHVRRIVRLASLTYAIGLISRRNPSTTKEQHEVVRSGSLTSVTSRLQDTGWGQNQGLSPVVSVVSVVTTAKNLTPLPWSGDLPRGPLRAHRSTTTSGVAAQGVQFKCRICLSDPTPTSTLTATYCGHLFCYE